MDLQPKQRDYMERSFQPNISQGSFEKDFEDFRPEIENNLTNLAEILENRLSNTNEATANKELLKKQIEACVKYAETTIVRETIEHGLDHINKESDEDQRLRRALLEDMYGMHKRNLLELARVLGLEPSRGQFITVTTETQGHKTETITGIKGDGIVLPDDIAGIISSLSGECSVIVGNNFKHQDELMNRIQGMADLAVEKL
jgi:hypothetical protein